MPVCSYVVLPAPGRARALADQLALMPECSVELSDHAELLILATDTDTAAADEALRARLEALDDMQCLTLVFGELPAEQEKENRS